MTHGDTATPDFFFEPEPRQILERLLPVYVETELYRALLESAASFFGAQMTAMRNASKAAGELIDTPHARDEPRPPGRDHAGDPRGRRRRRRALRLIAIRTNFLRTLTSHGQMARFSSCEPCNAPGLVSTSVDKIDLGPGDAVPVEIAPADGGAAGGQGSRLLGARVEPLQARPARRAQRRLHPLPALQLVRPRADLRAHPRARPERHLRRTASTRSTGAGRAVDAHQSRRRTRGASGTSRPRCCRSAPTAASAAISSSASSTARRPRSRSRFSRRLARWASASSWA